MPPRLDFSSFLRVSPSVFQPASICPFRNNPTANASTVAQRRKRQDPYAQAQAKARKAAITSRQEVLRAEREKARGDPVRGLTTALVKSFDDAEPNSATPDFQRRERIHRNYFLSEDEVESSLETFKSVTAPLEVDPSARGSSDPAAKRAEIEKHETDHETAAEAIRRIASTNGASSKDRTRINIRRCVDIFGRHNTDQVLRPKPPSHVPRDPSLPPNEKTPRAGPDTGSSEVQIAILTAKIRAVADYQEAHGRKDKHNKRNLRLLVHKRQKLLKYLRKKERGGERWQNCIQTLGLTDATWNGEISL